MMYPQEARLPSPDDFVELVEQARRGSIEVDEQLVQLFQQDPKSEPALGNFNQFITRGLVVTGGYSFARQSGVDFLRKLHACLMSNHESDPVLSLLADRTAFAHLDVAIRQARAIQAIGDAAKQRAENELEKEFRRYRDLIGAISEHRTRLRDSTNSPPGGRP